MEDNEKKKYKYSKETIKGYNDRFMEKHKEPIECPICLQKYKYHNKYNHLNTRIHKMAIMLKEKEKI